MTRSWLIRNKDKIILGPFSREMILQKYNENYFDEEDEISQGNGFWFWIKEKELLNEYLINNKLQDPLKPYIQNVNTDLDSDITQEFNIEHFSNRESDPEDITRQFSLNELKNDSINEKNIELNDKKIEIEIENVKEINTANDFQDNEIIKKAQRDDRYLYVIIFLLIVVLLGTVFYYKKILNRSIHFDEITSQFSPIQRVEAKMQKKKS